MDNTILELVKQVPALAVLVWLVYRFNTVMQQSISAQTEREKTFIITIQQALDNNTSALRESSRLFGRVEASIEDFEDTWGSKLRGAK